MELDEQPGVPQLSPSVGLPGPVLPTFKAFSRVDAASRRYLAKPGSRSQKFPLYPVALHVKRFEQQSLTSLCWGPEQGTVEQTL